MTRPVKTAIVVGAGIVGLTTACRLAEEGYAVTVIERDSGPGNGTSKGNAGQLLFDRIGAMGSASFLRGLPAALMDRSQGIRVHGLAYPSRWNWTRRFLRECTQEAWQKNTEGLLALAHLSRDAMQDFRSRHQMEIDWRRPGKLVTYATGKGLEAAARSANFQGQFGGRHEVLSYDECVSHEPALGQTERPIAGAVYLPDAEVGDCHKCCQELAGILQDKLGGAIRFKTPVTGLERDGSRVTGLRCGADVIRGDVFVLATGRATSGLLRSSFADIKPIVSILGISLTYPLGDAPPNLSVTDTSGRFVMVRLGDRLRVTGYAIFSDKLQARPADVQALQDKAQQLMPRAGAFDVAPDIWIGARPQTPDDLPMIGQAGAKNLFVNAGHGSLGWTLAFGSAEKLLRTMKTRAQTN